MPIYATKEALKFWKTGHARSLAASRFVTIAESKEDNTWRKTSCLAIKKGTSLEHKAKAHLTFIRDLSEAGASIIFAKLEARMIIDAGNGVLENGGICLDRTSGTPFIPGSAIKGCARRYAIWKLGETENLDEKVILLAKICHAFGYGDQEWTSGRSDKGQSVSDFWLAMHPLSEPGKQHDELRQKNWNIVADKAALTILNDFGRSPQEGKSNVDFLPNLTGSVCFLPAYPARDPGIDIDVLTPHHKDYYDTSKPKPSATDDENPIPIYFPTIPKGASFSFAIAPKNQQTKNLIFAKTCLEESLCLFGIGAKTSAGYGWFTPDSEAQTNFDNQVLVRNLESKYSDFINWCEEEKEEAILELSDQPDNCVIWNQTAPSHFTPICEYAKNLGITLL